MFRKSLNKFLESKDEKVLLIGVNHEVALDYNLLSYNSDLIQKYASQKKVAIVIEGLSQDVSIHQALANPEIMQEFDHHFNFDKILICHTLEQNGAHLFGSESSKSDPAIDLKAITNEDKIKINQIVNDFKPKRLEVGNVEFSKFIKKLSTNYDKIIFIGGKAHLPDLASENKEFIVKGMQSRIPKSTHIGISQTTDKFDHLNQDVDYNNKDLHGKLDFEIQTSNNLLLKARIENMKPQEIANFFMYRINETLDAFDRLPIEMQKSNIYYLPSEISKELKFLESTLDINLKNFKSKLNAYVEQFKSKGSSNLFFKVMRKPITTDVLVNNLIETCNSQIKKEGKSPRMANKIEFKPL